MKDCRYCEQLKIWLARNHPAILWEYRLNKRPLHWGHGSNTDAEDVSESASYEDGGEE